MLAAAHFLANKPEGWNAVYLIVALTMLEIAVVVAGMQKRLYDALMAQALAFLVLALLRPA
jgi:hypothetical protein